MLPLILAGAIWTYNICKIVERAGSAKDAEGGDSAEKNEASKDDADEENITISNSAEAIKFIRSKQKSLGQRKRDWSGGERYGK